MISKDYHEKANYWHTNEDWFWIDEKNVPHIKDDAPEEAKESFRLFMSEETKP